MVYLSNQSANFRQIKIMYNRLFYDTFNVFSLKRCALKGFSENQT